MPGTTVVKQQHINLKTATEFLLQHVGIHSRTCRLIFIDTASFSLCKGLCKDCEWHWYSCCRFCIRTKTSWRTAVFFINYTVLSLIKAPSTRIRFCLKTDFFPPVCPTVNTYPLKTVTENAFFKIALKSKDSWKRQLFSDKNGVFRIRWFYTSYTASITHAA